MPWPLNDNLNCTPLEQAKDMISRVNSGQSGIDLLNSNSTDVGMNNAELNTRAFMSTLKQTENGGNAALPYNAWNGFSNKKVKTFTSNEYDEAPEDYADHPGFPKGSKSSAAGAYQLLGVTFKGYDEQNKDINDFSPEAQDKIVLKIFKYKNATSDVANGALELVSKKLTQRKGGEQFASLPGGSQSHGLTLTNLKVLFKKNLSNELNDKSNIATPKGKLTK